MSNQPAGFRSVAQRLVGVIDLKAGQAVHAVPGDRDSYEGVKLSSGRSCRDPVQLAGHYYDQGLSRLYIADLDGIESGAVQAELIGRLLRDGPAWDVVLLDLGWTGSSQSKIVRQLSKEHSSLHFIAATEAAQGLDALQSLSQVVGSQRTILGMDYRKGEFVSRTKSQPSDWFDAAKRIAVDSLVVLDVATVGTNDVSRSLDCCRRVKGAMPVSQIYSGGGIASVDDVESFGQAGSDFCLVATCLL